MRSILAKFAAQENLNFLLTNRLPRRLATRVVGYVSKIETPLLSRSLIGLWRLFADIDLSDSASTHFRSLHDCFIRELKPGARPIDQRTNVLTSPCDAIVGASGRVDEQTVYQIKGFPYTLADLLLNVTNFDTFRNGRFITLRLTSSMYHRFHAPSDLKVKKVSYISGDTWNVNPITLKRIEKLFCKNERAVIECQLEPSGRALLLVPVAAILVASIRLHFFNTEFHLRQIAKSHYRRTGSEQDSNVFEEPCDHRLSKGQEMGWFEHGSTIIVFVPDGFDLMDNVIDGASIRAGQPLLRIPEG